MSVSPPCSYACVCDIMMIATEDCYNIHFHLFCEGKLLGPRTSYVHGACQLIAHLLCGVKVALVACQLGGSCNVEGALVQEGHGRTKLFSET